MRNLRGLVLGVVLGTVVVQGSCFAADDVTAETVTQEMQGAIVEMQKPENQAIYDAAYQGSMEAGKNVVITQLMVEKTALITAVRAAIAANQGNLVEVEALTVTLNQLLVNNNFSEYTKEFQKLATTNVNNATDQVALTNSLSGVNEELVVVKNVEEDTNLKLEKLRVQSTQYSQSQSGAILSQAPAMPGVADGSPSIVYGVDASGVYYFVDAGSWSNVVVGGQYGVIDDDGNGAGNLEIVLCFDSFSVGILMRTDNVSVGYRVNGLVTCKTPPNQN